MEETIQEIKAIDTTIDPWEPSSMSLEPWWEAQLERSVQIRKELESSQLLLEGAKCVPEFCVTGV